jgi:intein/homing endonuclease
MVAKNQGSIKFSVLWGDKEFAEEFSRCFYRVYGILKHPTKEERWELERITPYATVIIDSKLAYLDLKNYCNFGTFTWRVPKQVKGAGEDVKRAFLQAYFDSDGSVDVKRHMITADSANHAGLKEIEDLLMDFGVEVAGIYPYKKGDKEYFHLAVCNWCNLTNFLRIGFRLKRKQEKLLESLRKYRNRWLRHTNELYLSKKRSKYVFNDVQKAAKELRIITSGSLAQTLGICRRHAISYIHRLREQGLLIQLTPPKSHRCGLWKYNG